MNLKGKKILVTGGAGFIGSHTVDALIEQGAKVIVVDDLSTGRRENINPKAKFYELNVADQNIGDILEKEKPNIIYHLAFYVMVPNSINNPLLDLDLFKGTLQILQKAKTLNVEKVILASSGLLYGNNLNLPVSEDEPVDPVSPYVVSKRAIEQYLEFYHKTFNLPYVVLRYATVYGPRQVVGAMADYIRKLSSGSQADIWGDGNKTRDYVYISDVVQANLLALKVPNEYVNPIFNVGTAKQTTLNELYSKIADILGKTPQPNYHQDRPGEHLYFALNNKKIFSELQWKPRVGLDEGLEAVIKSWRLDT